MDKKTVVISAFPGTGKSYLFKHQNDYNLTIMDSDSSNFSWTVEDGVKKPNFRFPLNYIEHIKENLGSVDVILVSSHHAVRAAMTEHGIKYVSVYPWGELKDEYLQRFIDRGNDDAFVKLLSTSWDTFISQMENDKNPEFHHVLAHGYISTFIHLIIEQFREGV